MKVQATLTSPRVCVASCRDFLDATQPDDGWKSRWKFSCWHFCDFEIKSCLYWAQILSPWRRWIVPLSTSDIINLKTFITDKTTVDTFPEIFRQFSTFMRRTRRQAQTEAISQKSWNKSNSISWVNKTTDEKIEKLFRVEKLTIFSNYLNCIKSSSHTFVVEVLEKSHKCFHSSHTHRRKLSTFSLPFLFSRSFTLQF